MAIEDEDEDEDSMALLPFGFGSASISTVGSFIRSPQCGGPPPITRDEIATITIKNKCSRFIWPATLTTSPLQPQLLITGFELVPGASKSLNIQTPWTGRVWARTRCSNDTIVQNQVEGNSKGVFGHNCLTGDCGGGSIECKGAAGESPATLVEFSLAKDGKDFYDISLVDGFNILASITTQGSSSRIRPCLSVNCRADVNKDCPKELQVKSNDEVIACKSACLAFNQPRDCCTGEFNDPNKCKPTEFSKFFKDRCPNAYSYAYDDSSVFSCDNKPNYVITFCG